MLRVDAKQTKAQLRKHRQQCEKFAAPAADAIGAAEHCLFSLLPYAERFRQAAGWYDACAQAMLRGNYAPLDEWIRLQACLAAKEHFELEDLLQLLRICRRSAIDVAGWDEDVFSAVDDVINEGLIAVRAKVPWKISDVLNYLKQTEDNPAISLDVNEAGANFEMALELDESEHRKFGRNHLALPIRVRLARQQGLSEEITHTRNVSLGGLYFRTLKNYSEGSPLEVTYPYWTDPGSINREYSARIARLDRFPDGALGVAVEFLRSLRDKTA